MQKPELADDLVIYSDDGPLEMHRDEEGRERWYYAKPETGSGFYIFLIQLYHAWLVLRNKATAVQYMRDRM